MTKSVGVHEAKTNLSRLLEAVAGGEEVEITNRGRVVARLVSPRASGPHLGFDLGRIRVSDDFDAPLHDDLQAAFEQ
jgi:prevent-host-death family protein